MSAGVLTVPYTQLTLQLFQLVLSLGHPCKPFIWYPGFTSSKGS